MASAAPKLIMQHTDGSPFIIVPEYTQQQKQRMPTKQAEVQEFMECLHSLTGSEHKPNIISSCSQSLPFRLKKKKTAKKIWLQFYLYICKKKNNRAIEIIQQC